MALSPEAIKNIKRTVQIGAVAGLLLQAGCQPVEQPDTPAKVVEDISRSNPNEYCVQENTESGTTTLCLTYGQNRWDTGGITLAMKPLVSDNRFLDQYFDKIPGLIVIFKLDQSLSLPLRDFGTLEGGIQIGKASEKAPRDSIVIASKFPNPTKPHTISFHWKNWRVSDSVIDSTILTDFEGTPVPFKGG